MNKKLGMIVAIGAAVILIGAVGISMASDYSDTNMEQNEVDDRAGDEEPKMRMLDRFNLTEEQKEEIIDTVISMKEDGEDRDEIRDTVIEMLEDYGVDVPEDMGEGSGEKHRRGRGRGDCEK